MPEIPDLDPKRAAWYALTPAQRWGESQKLWLEYVAAGGSLDPDPDPQSPFYDPDDCSPPRPIPEPTWHGLNGEFP